MSEANLDETQRVKANQPDPTGDTMPVKTRLPGEAAENPAATRRVGVQTPPVSEVAQIPPSSPFIEEINGPNIDVDTQPRKPKRWPLILLGILLILILGGVGTFLGYRSAQAAQLQAYESTVTQQATEQFMLGLEAQSKGNYALARQHFEYVIRLDPNFPGVQQKLTEVMLAAASTQTPTPQVILPTITPSPTPDLRGEEEIFNNAKALMANKEWGQAWQVLNALRDKNIVYRAVEVDGMYYVTLRHLGLQKISRGELEGGLYDLALVERFGPLDVEANGVRTWARLYITGARFWGVRWDKVVAAFSEIYPYFPSMIDSSGMTATERFRIASIKYGDQLSAEGKFCEALQQYQNAQGIVADANVEPTATAAFIGCFPPTPTPGPTLTPTLTPTVTVGPSLTPTTGQPVPSDTPPAPSDTPQVPSETPSDTPTP